MTTSNTASRGMVVTPHHLATQSAVAILREGGTAIDATVAAAATLAVVYPHLNSIGGDAFWLIIPPHEDPLVIEACGAAGSLANRQFFSEHTKIPFRGPKSAITVAGTVGGWQEALNYVSECGYQKMSVSKLLADAIYYAENGFPVSTSQEIASKEIKEKERLSIELERIFFPDGRVPKAGENFCQKKLAKTLRFLSENGLNSFYEGHLAKLIAEDMAELGIPITEEDLANYCPLRKKPARMVHKYGELLNTPPPTQGLVSLAILGILDKIKIEGKNDGEFIHATVEATKKAFAIKKNITDPCHSNEDPQYLIADKALTNMTKNINFQRASSFIDIDGSGDTIWMGVMDNKGFSVSFIQSTYHNFGSGLVLPKTGIIWHNRGVAFSLNKNDAQFLNPGKKPFHTLNPAAARLNDGRVIVYGTRGGDGQPQTQATIFHRYVVQKLPLQKSISDPRWLYGRISGPLDDTLKLENRFSEETVRNLVGKGHKVVMLPSYSEVVGHAGALVRHPNGMMEGAYDPRSNGSAAGF